MVIHKNYFTGVIESFPDSNTVKLIRNDQSFQFSRPQTLTPTDDNIGCVIRIQFKNGVMQGWKYIPKHNARYVEKGYESQADYYKTLAEEYDVSLIEVIALAEILGTTEDFDGLITSLEDI